MPKINEKASLKKSQSPNFFIAMPAMFPLSCARVHMHTGREMSAHKKTWGTHKFFFKKCFAHISYMSFRI